MNCSEVHTALGKVTNSCFVIMPFASLFEQEYSVVIRPAIEAVGLSCIRGDEIYSQQSIVQDIWKSIRSSRVIVAELSGRNPNVMYELGLAHAIGKPIVLLTRAEEDVPFDLKNLRYIYYDTNNPQWGLDLRESLSRALQKVLDTSEIGFYLQDVTVKVALPKPPVKPVKGHSQKPSFALDGVWKTSWSSIQTDRTHFSVLEIPKGHQTSFDARMIVSYVKGGMETIVEETLKAHLSDQRLQMEGVSYTYLQKGNSLGYSLDCFDLRVDLESEQLIGSVKLKFGVRAVTFKRSL